MAVPVVVTRQGNHIYGMQRFQSGKSKQNKMIQSKSYENMFRIDIFKELTIKIAKLIRTIISIDSINADTIKNLQSDHQFCNLSHLYIYYQTYPLILSFFPMSNKAQSAPLSRFYPYLGFDPYYFYQSGRTLDLFSKFKKSELILQPPKNHVLVKVQEVQDVETQKPQIHSADSHLPVKKQHESDEENQIQCKQEHQEQGKLYESSSSKRNETKNISKNFGKAILSFAKSNSKFAKKLLKRFNIEKQQLIAYIKKARRNLNSLQDLRQMWGAGDEYDNMKKCLRIASYHFMRKHCLEYIFNSRIRSVSAHTKYRHRLMQGMSKPSQFTNIKVN